MINPSQLKEFAEQLHATLPEPLKIAKTDIEEKIKMIIQSQCAKLDLVSRAEFDSAMALLRKTQAKVEALQQEVERLGSHILKDH